MKHLNAGATMVTWIVRSRWLVMGGLAVVLAFGVVNLNRCAIENGLTVWFPKGDRAFADYQTFQEEFGNDETILAAYTVEQDALSDRGLDLAARAVAQLVRIKGVARVRSLADPGMRGYFLGRDTRTAVLVIEPDRFVNTDTERPRLLSEVRAVLSAIFSGEGTTYRLAGLGVLYEEINRVTLEDSRMLMGASLLVIIVILMVRLRRPRYVLLSLGAILYTLVVSLGTFFFFGGTITMLSIIVPGLIITYSVSDLIHIIHRRHIMAVQSGSPLQTTLACIVPMLLPCFLTSATTAVGFATLSFSSIAIIRDLGLFAGASLMLEYFVTIIFLSLGFASDRRAVAAPPSRPPHGGASRYASFLVRRRAAIIVAVVLVVGAAIPGLLRLRVDTYSMELLDARNAVYQDSRAIERDYGFYTPLEITVSRDAGGPWTAEDVANIRRLEDNLVRSSCTDKTVSPVTILGAISKVKNDAAVATALGSLPIRVLKPYVRNDRASLRVTATIVMASASGFARVMRQAEAVVDETLDGTGLRARIRGYIPLYVRMMELVYSTQISTSLAAAAVIFSILCWYAGSLRAAVAGLIANITPMILVLGIMGWARIPLDIATVTITSVAIGMIVDNTIHFLHRWKEARKRSIVGEDAMHYALGLTLNPMIWTSMIISMGFSLMAFAQTKSVSYFGTLCALVMVLALAGDAVLLPALLGGSRGAAGGKP